jgi:hypothetical protein
MTEIEELETHIRNLPKEDFLKFRDWFYQLGDIFLVMSQY